MERRSQSNLETLRLIDDSQLETGRATCVGNFAQILFSISSFSLLISLFRPGSDGIYMVRVAPSLLVSAKYSSPTLTFRWQTLQYQSS